MLKVMGNDLRKAKSSAGAGVKTYNPYTRKNERGFNIVIHDDRIQLHGTKTGEATCNMGTQASAVYMGFIDTASARVLTMVNKQLAIEMTIDDGKLVITEREDRMKQVTRITLHDIRMNWE